MDFSASIADLARRSAHATQHAMTEEATKTSVVLPFIKALGFDVFNLEEVTPEFIADLGTKKGEKVDFALKINGKIVILIEAKPISSSLGADQHSQLFRYFTVTDARVAILTNGREFWFFSDSELPNKMDKKPFFSFDIQAMDERAIAELAKFQKHLFSIDVILEPASKQKYIKLAASFIKSQLEKPDDEFIRYVGKQIYDGTITKGVVDMLRNPICLALDEVVKDRLSQKLNVAFRSDGGSTEAASVNNSAVTADESRNTDEVTSEDELQAYMIVRAIAAQKLPLERVHIRDAKSYCAVLIDDNNRKPLCRFYFNSKTTRYVGIFDKEKNETKELITDLRQIYNFSEQIRSTASSYTDKGNEVSSDTPDA